MHNAYYGDGAYGNQNGYGMNMNMMGIGMKNTPIINGGVYMFTGQSSTF